MMRANPCRICETDEHLRPMQRSETGQYWVTCDECGQVGDPAVPAEGGNPVKNWNEKNPPVVETAGA